MDPASLPLEVFIGILVQLPIRDIWRLRSTAKSWAAILSSDIVVDQASNGRDLAELKRDHISKPVSCVDLTTKHDWYLPTQYAFRGQHLAYLTHERTNQGFDVALYLQDIEGRLHSWQLETRSAPSQLMMEEYVAFIADRELIVVSLDGQLVRRKIPGTWRGGAVVMYEHKVAILRNLQERNLHDPASLIEANTIYLYDNISGKWSKISTPETWLRSRWVQSLVLDESVHTVSIGRDVDKPAGEDGMLPYIMHVRSGRLQWTHEFKMPPGRLDSDVRGCGVHREGDHYVVDVQTEAAQHSIRMTTDRVIENSSAIPNPRRDPEYKGVTGGLRTQAGFI